MKNERFSTEVIGRYVLEHDRADGSLRLSWSGAQVFMSEEEARALLVFVLTPSRVLIPLANSIFMHDALRTQAQSERHF